MKRCGSVHGAEGSITVQNRLGEEGKFRVKPQIADKCKSAAFIQMQNVNVYILKHCMLSH